MLAVSEANALHAFTMQRSGGTAALNLAQFRRQLTRELLNNRFIEEETVAAAAQAAAQAAVVAVAGNAAAVGAANAGGAAAAVVVHAAMAAAAVAAATAVFADSAIPRAGVPHKFMTLTKEQRYDGETRSVVTVAVPSVNNPRRCQLHPKEGGAKPSIRSYRSCSPAIARCKKCYDKHVDAVSM